VVSYLTSRYPGEVLAGDPATFGIPDGVPALPEVLAGLGYRTGGFFANPTLRASNGFGRGFETFYTPSSMDAIQAHADEINRRALPWLRAHRDDPFFLYVHYIDPHDPYWNPDLIDGRSPYFDDPGGISGRWVHGVYAGRIEVDDLERQVRHFTALYDSEIRFVDRAIGRLLETIPDAVLAETLVVLTSDHGEELYDHGGWKHGHTLYEDQIHVPLILRWDGRIRPGSRLPGTVRLVDLAPTLVAAAGGEAPSSWQGVDLLPALTGEGQLPRLAAFSQHLSAGPMRTAAVLEGEKLILFNRREPFQPGDSLQEYLYGVDMGRLGRVELYDLAADPGERRDLWGGEPSPEIGGLDATVQNHLHRSLRGVRAMIDPLPSGGRLTGELRFDGPPVGAVPLYLGPDDRLDVDGAVVRFEIAAEGLTKGFLLPGEPPGLVGAELRLDGQPLPPGRLRYGPGTPYTGRPLEPAAFDSVAYPPPGDLPGLRLWRYSGDRPDSAGVDPETRRSLEALGYIQ
jgi:arylsulfatase A-like enzyme